MLFSGNIFGKVDLNYYHLKPETNPETWYVNEKFLILMTNYISLKRSRKMLFKVNVSEKR